mmetsp:Transcript_22689/g.41078  ORF Transcript_22689/g.41078 Transcript_22689/m.41078 type:complete len:1656 (+) Transcript_22689:42-5009(+)|eukprot:CAMPEP_0197619716 /NCGR_PEP_ID=MMETSP1338-20131121/700_1 /TAXON_ID=43686 ORGANISM="Pelagodinium beii, Strain RCC1491" /NCGR_SAMPLE_ID=MMETSP1338 /ASSEMBLY_ACC=CAM_ASM_000754 /LENGTH=1655 /DNA_ID=CAMNT_0043188737 /DNA_START=42 /DNA_END=5009 /DNA_ORIENTATION=-
MAGLADAQQVGKEDFLDALSNKDGATTAAADADGLGLAGDATALQTDEDEDRPPQPEDLDEGFREFLEADDSAQEYGDVDLGLDFEEEEEQMSEVETEERKRVGGIVASYQHSPELHHTLGHQRTNKAFERLQHELTSKVRSADDAKIALENEEQRLRQLRKQAEIGQLADPARLSYQELEVGKAWDRLTVAEKARDAAELALLRVSPESAKASGQASEEHKGKKRIAQERQAKEVKRAQTLIAKDEVARQVIEDRQAAHETEQMRRESEAVKHQRKGKNRLREAQDVQNERRQLGEQVREARFDHDAQRMLTLKASHDAITRKIQSQNERRDKKTAKIKEERETQKNKLLSEGQNPYEVWRREEMVAHKEEMKIKTMAQAEMRSEKLMEQLIVEDRAYKKRLEAAKVKREQAEDFQKEVGNYMKEKKITTYIRKMTIGNVDVLDPTGTALRIDPSKVTIQKTHAFGLGRARAEEIEKVDREVQKGTRRAEKWKSLRPEESDEEEVVQKQTDFMRSASGGMDPFAGPATEMTSSHDDDEEDTGEKKLWVPKLTVLEEQYMAAARERQKQNICSVQRCLGKEFKGDAFLAKPAVIAFNDFEVGQKYRQVIEVTNVSLTFNQFKLLPLDDKVKDFFEIQFVPPGRMSAGVTRYITLWFIPKVSQDIVSTFPILAKTGRIDFPLRCTTKKTILTVTPQDADAHPVIDFGPVLSGESAQNALIVKNSGALPANFSVEPYEEGEGEERQFLEMISWRPEKSSFKEHGSTKISFSFTPTVLGSFSTTLRLSIANGAPGDANYEEERRILVRGSCLDVPIFVDQEEYDMQTCVYNHTFRENVVVRNRVSVAMKIQVQKPVQIDGELQLNTTLAYIQGNGNQAIQVKFSPKQDFLDRNPQYRDSSRPDVAGAFRIPMCIVGADQVLPVNTALIGTLTSNNLTFLPNVLNFGRATLGSSVMSRLTIVNESTLKQRFAFMRLPSYLSVQDVPSDVLQEEMENRLDTVGGTIAVVDGGGDGTFGTLLPGERRQLSVTYSPEAATEMDYKIQFKVITGSLCVRDFLVECKGQGVSPTLSFSETQVDMASIPCDASSKESVVMTNNSKVAQTINVLVPPFNVAGLRVSPICCTLEPRETKRLQIVFGPRQEYCDLLKMPEKEKPEPTEEEAAPPMPAGDAEEESVEEEPQMTQEEFSRQQLTEVREHGGRRWEEPENGTIHASWRLPICVRPAGIHQPKTNGKPPLTCYLGINTCVLPTALKLDPQKLDFGEVTAGQRMILPLTITNMAQVDGAQDLQMEALPENQCFTVLNAARPVAGKPFQFMVEFQPQLVQIYQTTLQLTTQNTRVQVPLRGRGVRPVLKIEPEDGVLHMGSVVYSKGAKDYTTEKFVIRNESPFELNYKLETLIRADPNHTGPPPFTLTPASGTVEANGSKTVTVTFRPHRPLGLFREKILVNVPNQKEPTFVYLYGHCFKYQAFAMYGMDFTPFGRKDMDQKAAFTDSLAVGTGSGFSAGTPFEHPPAQIKNFSLVFEQGELMKTLLIGAGVPPGTPSAPQDKLPAVTYDFQILPGEFSNYFTVEVPEGAGKPEKQAKGNLLPGKPSLKVAFRYSPPDETSLAFGGVNLDLLQGIGQWITCQAKGILAGGSVPANDPASQEIIVELRAYLQQI